MDVREKLVELIEKASYECDEGTRDLWDMREVADGIADFLIANGVTVQDGKPLEEFLHPIDAYKGLKAKYLVFKADTGKVVDNCFILRPDKDAAAVEALRAYANATDNKTLAEDIYSWVGKGEPVPEWISVKDRLPEKEGEYITYTDRGEIHFDCYCIYPNHGTRFWIGGNGKVTHWMEKPQPPKGE